MLGGDGFKGIPFIKKLSDETTSDLKKFKSRNTYLNQFLERRSRKHQDELLANTYLLYYRDDNCNYDILIGYYTLSNSSLRATELIRSKFHQNKQYDDYPSVLIGRLAVSKEWERNGFGDFILDSIKLNLTIDNHTSACRFLIVHALKESFGFYSKNDFCFWTKEDSEEDVRLMYFDLKSI